MAAKGNQPYSIDDFSRLAGKGEGLLPAEAGRGLAFDILKEQPMLLAA